MKTIGWRNLRYAVCLASSAVVLSANATCPAFGEVKPDVVERRACEAVSIMLNEQVRAFKGSRLAVGNDPPVLEPVMIRLPSGEITYAQSNASSYIWNSQWIGLPPPQALVANWYVGNRASIGICLKRKYVEAPKSEAESEGPTDAPANDGSKGVGYTIRMTLPVMNSAADEAILLLTRYGEGLGGGTFLVHLKRSGGTWRKVGDRMLAIS